MWRFDMESYNINLQVRKLTCKNSFSQEMLVSSCFYVLCLQKKYYIILPDICVVPWNPTGQSYRPKHYSTSYLPSGYSDVSMGNTVEMGIEICGTLLNMSSAAPMDFPLPWCHAWLPGGHCHLTIGFSDGDRWVFFADPGSVVIRDPGDTPAITSNYCLLSQHSLPWLNI